MIYKEFLRSISLIILTATLVVLSASTGFAQKQSREDVNAAASAPGNDEVTRLRQRVEQLEEQLVDMQVTMGTIESLGRRGRAAMSAQQGPQQFPSSQGGYSGGDSGRIQTLETQIGALTRQVEIMARQLNAQGGPGGAGAQAGNFGFRPGGNGSQSGGQSGGPVQGFGEVTVTPGAGAQPQSFDQGQLDQNAGQLTPQNAKYDNRPPKTIYEEAYKYLLVQDYGAAENAFATFLGQFPNDKLAGNAQYWLGESYYVRGQYKNAAGAFLKGYKVYDKSQKAPDSLLKLAMSLKRLGQKDAACETFGELGTRFPRAPSHIKQRARSERRRSGC